MKHYCTKHILALVLIVFPILSIGQGKKAPVDSNKQRISQLAKLIQQYDARYDQFNYIADGNFVIVSDSNMQQGIVDISGKIFLPIKYRIIPQAGTSLFLVVSDTKMGLLNKHKKWVLPMKYDRTTDCLECTDMSIFSKGYACLSLNGKFGIVDTNGKTLIPFKFDLPFRFDRDNRMLSFYDDSDEANPQEYITDLEGNLLIGPYEIIGPFSEGLASFRKGDRYGFLNTKGRIVLPCKYENGGWEFVNGYAIVVQNGKHSLIDTKGNTKLVFDTPLAFEYNIWGNSMFIVNNEIGTNDQYGAIDINGNSLIPCRYTQWYIINSNYLAMLNDKEECDIYNKEGRLVAHFTRLIGMDYDEGIEYSSNYLAVLKDSMWGFVDSNFKTVVPFRYKEAKYLGYGYGSVVTTDGQTQFINMSGNTVVSGPYELLYPASADLFKFYTVNPKDYGDMIVGYIDIHGNSTADKAQLEQMRAWLKKD